MQSNTALTAAIALTRFGMGARPDEIAAIQGDPQHWLRRQIRREGAASPRVSLERTEDRLRDLYAYRDDQRRERRRTTPMRDTSGEPGDPVERARQMLIEATADAFLARARLAATTDAGFAERWALFWTNWFTVSAVKFQAGLVVPQYEAEAIRPNVFGRFEDLLIAAESHPAMLLYLDQAQSIGPNSVAGRRRDLGLNENLAREILELHTVGAEAGFGQADVTELARALTGWSITPPPESPDIALRQAQRGSFGYVFQPLIHEPGDRTVLGRRYSQRGRDQGRAILRDLAAHPATARRAATRLAVHFISDDPPASAVARLEETWRRTNGDLAAVAETLIACPEAWAPEQAKLKTPYDLVISSYRAADVAPRRVRQVQPILRQLGQPPYAPPSPEGWADEAAVWGAPDALVTRMAWARGFSDAVVPQGEPIEMAEAALGDLLGDRSRTAIRRAETRAEALALLLMAPEFQRR